MTNPPTPQECFDELLLCATRVATIHADGDLAYRISKYSGHLMGCYIGEKAIRNAVEQVKDETQDTPSQP